MTRSASVKTDEKTLENFVSYGLVRHLHFLRLNLKVSISTTLVILQWGISKRD